MPCIQIRTDSVKNAFLNNKESFKDKVVLNIGCEYGVLSIEELKIKVPQKTKEIVKKNDLSDKIIINKSKVEEAEVPKGGYYHL